MTSICCAALKGIEVLKSQGKGEEEFTTGVKKLLEKHMKVRTNGGSYRWDSVRSRRACARCSSDVAWTSQRCSNLPHGAVWLRFFFQSLQHTIIWYHEGLDHRTPHSQSDILLALWPNMSGGNAQCRLPEECLRQFMNCERHWPGRLQSSTCTKRHSWLTAGMACRRKKAQLRHGCSTLCHTLSSGLRSVVAKTIADGSLLRRPSSSGIDTAPCTPQKRCSFSLCWRIACLDA
jgi:hypothetical protein